MTVPDRVSRLGVLELRRRISERDRRILEHIAALRLMRAHQVQALLFPDSKHATRATAGRCCRRALERLTRERLLVRLERRVGGASAGSASFIYALAPLGQRVLDLGGPRRRLGEPSERFVAHTLAIAEFFANLAVEAAGGRFEILAWEAEPACWRKVATLGGTLALRPDLFVVLGVGDYELRWYIEIDLATEHMPAISRKCRLYHSYYKNGHEQRRHRVFPRVLWITDNDRRAGTLRATIAADRRLTADLFRVATSETALEAITEVEG